MVDERTVAEAPDTLCNSRIRVATSLEVSVSVASRSTSSVSFAVWPSFTGDLCMNGFTGFTRCSLQAGSISRITSHAHSSTRLKRSTRAVWVASDSNSDWISAIFASYSRNSPAHSPILL